MAKSCVVVERRSWRNFYNVEKFDAIARKSSGATSHGGKSTERRRNTSQPGTTKIIQPLAIVPAITISNPFLEAFPEEAQRKRFPNSLAQNAMATIMSRWRNNDRNSSLPYKREHVNTSRSDESNMINYRNDSTIHHLNISLTFPELAVKTQTRDPNRPRLSETLMRFLIQRKNGNSSLKGIGASPANHRRAHRARKMKNRSELEHIPKKFNISNLTVVNPLSTRKGLSESKNRGVKIKNNVFSRKDGKHLHDKMHNVETTKETGQKTAGMPKINVLNANDDNLEYTEATRRLEDVTSKTVKLAYNDHGVSAERSISMNRQESTDVVTRRFNDQIGEFLTPALRKNDSTVIEISSDAMIDTTTPRTTQDFHINRDSSATDASRKNGMMIFQKIPRRKYGPAYEKYYNRYLRHMLLATRVDTLTESTKVDARTSVTIGSVSSERIDDATSETRSVGNENITQSTPSDQARTIDFNRLFGAKGRNFSQGGYIEAKGNRSDDKIDFFGHKVRKNSKVAYYCNKYKLGCIAPSKRTASTTSSTNEVGEYNIPNTRYDQTSKSTLLSTSITGDIDTETAKIHKNDYRSTKTEKLLYESKSPNVVIYRHFPKTNQTLAIAADIDKASINASTSDNNLFRRDSTRRKTKCNARGMRKKLNVGPGKFHENNENTTGSSIDKSDIEIDSGLVSSGETSESINVDDCVHSQSRESQESKEILEVDDFGVLLNWTKASSMATTTPEIVTQTNENGSREKGSTERHNKRKNKGRRNDGKRKTKKKNRKPKRRKTKRTTVTSTTSDETTTVDYDNDYSTERMSITLSLHNDPEHDKADDNTGTSAGRSDGWHLTDEITTENLETQSSGVDKSVSEYRTKGSADDGLQTEETSNFITDTTPCCLSENAKKYKEWIATTTEISWASNWWSSNNVGTRDEESTNSNEDVTSVTATGDSVQDKVVTTDYYNTFSSGDRSSTYGEISISNSTASSSWRSYGGKNNETSDEERTAIRDTINGQATTILIKGTTDETIRNQGSEKWPGDWQSGTQPAIKGTTFGRTHNVISDFDVEETDASVLFGEDNNNDNGAVTSTADDYETDNCNENQHACDENTCIEEDQVCDGIVDCPNTNDEIDCEFIYQNRWEEHQRAKGAPPRFDNASADGCTRYEHPCDGMCISALNVCNSVKDCLDGTDEADCDSYEGTGLYRHIFWMIFLSLSRSALRPRHIYRVNETTLEARHGSQGATTFRDRSDLSSLYRKWLIWDVSGKLSRSIYNYGAG